MKKLTLTLIAAIALCGVTMAQTNRERGPRQQRQFNPEMQAQRMTDQMAQTYQLTDEQKAELLELNKEYAGKINMPAMQGNRHRPMAQRGMRRGGGPQGRPAFNPNAQPPMGHPGQLTDEQKEEFKANAEKRMKEREEATKAYNKKVKKIFTDKQYKEYEKNQEKIKEGFKRQPGEKGKKRVEKKD